MPTRTALISGAGVAGPTLAYWLLRAGVTPTVIEHAPGLRSGGYVIDFWGLGYDVAERMGLTDDLDRVGYRMREMRIVGENGERLAGFGTSVLQELTGGRYVTVRRSDLAALLMAKVADRCEAIFGDEIVSFAEDSEGVEVRFNRSAARRFDLVFGADGLHSRVRQLAFGPEDRFEIPLGYVAAAFEAEGYWPRDEDVFVIHNEPGAMVGRLALKDDMTLFLLVLVVEPGEAEDADGAPEQKALLAARLATMRWEATCIVSALKATTNLYFDRVSQIRLERWSKGRIALVGDAAFCPSLLAGQGSALAMTASYVLAGELARCEAGYAQGFERYEALLRPFLDAKQRGAKNLAVVFAPRTRLGLFFRNVLIRATVIPGLSRLAFGREITDRLILPQYDWNLSVRPAGLPADG